MKIRRVPVCLASVFGATLLYAGAAAAATGAAQVVTLAGQATAATAQGSIRALAVGSELDSGDTIVTNPNAYLRMKFTDGGYVILRPNTRFVIEDYKDTGKPSEDRSFFSLLKGGFRAVTGLVGKRNHDAYRIRTAVATIGIRGTDHEARICDRDCLDVYPPPKDGLYTGTIVGTTNITPSKGADPEVHAGQFSFTGPDGITHLIPTGQATPLTIDPIPPADPADCGK